MVRSLIMIALAIICGGAAAIGVNQTIRRQSPQSAQANATQTVIVASKRVARGEELTSTAIREVEWPVDLIPVGILSNSNEAIGRVALTAILPGEPLFTDKLTDLSGKGFFASIIKPGMRAYTIQTRGPSSSVAGFVRPKDRVDVLVNLRGTSKDQTGGGSTTTLLQAVEILAIDQILDSDVNAMQMLEIWAKGDNLTSVTLEVSPDQASLLALGQSYGELSLALRNSNDEVLVESIPATIQEIRDLEYAAQAELDLNAGSNDETTDPREQLISGMGLRREKEEPPPLPPPTYIHTLRGSQVGRVELTYSPEVNKEDQ